MPGRRRTARGSLGSNLLVLPGPDLLEKLGQRQLVLSMDIIGIDPKGRAEEIRRRQMLTRFAYIVRDDRLAIFTPDRVSTQPHVRA